MSNIYKNFIFFCGKGGVGKTTCAAATAVKLAKAGSKTLLFSTDPAHSLSDSLNCQLSNNVSEVANVANLFAIEIDAQMEVKAFITKFRQDINQFFSHTSYLDENDINEVLQLTLPGLDELMAVTKIAEYVRGKNDFTYFVCDTAPTGHTLRLLAMPGVVNEWIKVIAGLQWKYRYITQKFSNKMPQDEEFLVVLKDMVNSARQIFKNGGQAVFNVVTIPESMAILETKRLVRALNKMDIIVRNIIINSVVPENSACSFCSKTRESQGKYIELLSSSFSNIRVLTVPKHSSEINGTDALSSFSDHLDVLGDS